MNLDRADARRSTSTTPGAPGHGPFDLAEEAKRLKRRYTLWCVVAPSVIFMVVFGAICAHECTATPWLTFIYAPLIALALMVVVAAVMWLRASYLPKEERRSVRIHILTSILWGPLAAYGGFAATIMAVQFFGVLLGSLF
jgi:hypothetical protein